MELVEILLSVGCILLFLMLIQLLSLNDGLRSVKNYIEAFAVHTDDSDRVRTEILEELQQVRQDQLQILDDISEIKYVTDVIYKYKLPNKEMQAMLDRVEIDNEVSDRIMGARRDKAE